MITGVSLVRGGGSRVQVLLTSGLRAGLSSLQDQLTPRGAASPCRHSSCCEQEENQEVDSEPGSRGETDDGQLISDPMIWITIWGRKMR